MGLLSSSSQPIYIPLMGIGLWINVTIPADRIRYTLAKCILGATVTRYAGVLTTPNQG